MLHARLSISFPVQVYQPAALDVLRVPTCRCLGHMAYDTVLPLAKECSTAAQPGLLKTGVHACWLAHAAFRSLVAWDAPSEVALKHTLPALPQGCVFI